MISQSSTLDSPFNSPNNYSNSSSNIDSCKEIKINKKKLRDKRYYRRKTLLKLQKENNRGQINNSNSFSSENHAHIPMHTSFNDGLKNFSENENG
jgi:hypothetical protein